mmetsp:Transcript_29217/g.77926  ORF Transcript_29217/g.77926 Transcript_29217/m.77926 type:complete len:258 (+) Transcript_29217:213-986(+)
MRQSSLREELALKAVETVHASLALRGRAPELEAELAGVELLPELGDGLGADVLHAVLESLNQIRQVAVHRALVLHRPGHALCHFHGGPTTEIAVVRALLHGIDGAHAAVPLQPHASVRVGVLAGSLLRAGKQAATHRRSGAQAQGLDDVPRARDATIRQDRNPMRASELGDAVNRRSLRSATSAHLLGRADGADAHSHAEGVHAAINKMLRLPHRDDISADDLQVRELGLHPTDDVMLEGAITLAAVHDDGVHAGSH